MQRKKDLKLEVIKLVKEVNSIPRMKDITCKNRVQIFSNNGLKVSESQVNHVFKRKADLARPLTGAMYGTLKVAIKKPKKYLLLKKTVTRVESQEQHCNEMGLPVPLTLSLPEEELIPEELPPKAAEVKASLKTVMSLTF